MGAGVKFPLEIAGAEITVDRFANIAIGLLRGRVARLEHRRGAGSTFSPMIYIVAFGRELTYRQG